MDEKLSSKRYGLNTIIDLNNKNSSPTLILEFIGFDKNVLEIGTSTGYISKILKERGNRVTGIEIDDEAGLVAQEYCDRMIIGDVETLDLDKNLEPASFNVIICGDVLEHLKNPANLLKKIRKFLKPGGYLVVSLPNFCHGDVLLNILSGDFRYTPVGLLDETHLRFFGMKNIFALFAECGYQISDIRTTNFDIGNTELAISQKRIPHDLLSFIRSLPNSNVYQFIFTAYPSENVKIPLIEEIDIINLFSESLVETRHEIQSPLLQVLSAKNQEISAKNQEIQEITTRVQSMVQILNDKDKQLLELTNRIQSLEQIISAIETSIVWQLMTKFHQKVIERILPQNTQRRKNFDQRLTRLRSNVARILTGNGRSEFKKNILLSPIIKYFNLLSDFKKTMVQHNKKTRFYLKRSEITPEKMQEIREEIKQFNYLPKLSIITPVYNVDQKWLKFCTDSVLQQIYENWEFCLVDDASTKKQVIETLKRYSGSDDRIRIGFNEKNLGISETTNKAIKMASGEYIVFLDNDDLLSKDALFEVVKLLNEHPDADVIYSDEDKLNSDEELCEPFFKPDWSPEYFRGVMYVGHLLTVRKTIAEKVGLLDKKFDFVQDYEFMLRISETTSKIYHIPKILYHWRKIKGSVASNVESKGDVGSIQVKAVNSHLQRLQLPAIAQKSHLPHRVIISPLQRSKFPLVSIIIPTKDNPELIKRCLKSIFETTTYPHFEVIIVDNNTTNEEAIDIINSYPVKKVDYQGTFNFSKINNFGSNYADGDYLIFLNNDTFIQSKDWIENLLYYVEQPDVAAAGPLLIFPDNTVQHAGVVLGFRGTADHIMRNYPFNCDGYAGSLICAREVSAVTAACMMVKKSLFDNVGGFNEYYSIIYQDVDLCLKFLTKGYRIIYNPRVMITHYECSTRDKNQYDLIDKNLLLDQWEEVIKNGDIYYNCNFDLTNYGIENRGYILNIKEEIY